MQIVGHFLQKEAIKEQSGDRDLFARSAYNRYYYTVFLATRRMLTEINGKWAGSPHKSYPEILNGTIMKSFKNSRLRAVKNGDGQLIELLQSGIRSAQSLASLIEKANGVRVVADYEPAEPVKFSSAGRFSLKSVEITDAHNWNAQVEVWIIAITQAWKQINA